MRVTHRFVIQPVKLRCCGNLRVDRLKVWPLGRGKALKGGKLWLGRLVIHLRKKAPSECAECRWADPIKVLSKQAVALKTDIKHRGYFMWTKPVSIIRINRQLPPFQIFYVRLRDTLAFRGDPYDNAHENLNRILWQGILR